MIRSDKTDFLEKYPITRIFQIGAEAYCSSHSLPPDKKDVILMMAKCKTGELGYNQSICEDCGNVETHSCSCNRKDCPSCQSAKAEKWVYERNTEKIDGIAYYHLVFTVPYELNTLIYINQKVLLNLLFTSSAQTIIDLCKDDQYMGALPGIMSVLHSHGQQMNFHPHIHTMISGGGLTKSGNFVETKHKGFLFPIQKASPLFRGKFLNELKKLYDKARLNLYGPCEKLKDLTAWNEFINTLYATDWNLFLKETFNGNGNAIKYLSRYTFRTAISNSRIISVTEENVTFRYKDYSDKNKTKTRTVSIENFIHLFSQHILPKRFNRVRFYGFLTNSKKIQNLKLINRIRENIYVGNPYKELSILAFIRLINDGKTCRCPKCGGHMIFKPPDMPIERLLGIQDYMLH